MASLEPNQSLSPLFSSVLAQFPNITVPCGHKMLPGAADLIQVCWKGVIILSLRVPVKMSLSFIDCLDHVPIPKPIIVTKRNVIFFLIGEAESHAHTLSQGYNQPHPYFMN